MGTGLGKGADAAVRAGMKKLRVHRLPVLAVGHSRGDGAHALLKRLEAVDFPPEGISVRVVRSHGHFVADHLSVLDTTPAARAAFWAPLDRIVARYTP